MNLETSVCSSFISKQTFEQHNSPHSRAMGAQGSTADDSDKETKCPLESENGYILIGYRIESACEDNGEPT